MIHSFILNLKEKYFTLSVILSQTNLILCSQSETIVSYSKLLLLSCQYEINYPFKYNLLLVPFEPAWKSFQQWKCSLRLKYAKATSYLFSQFSGGVCSHSPSEGWCLWHPICRLTASENLSLEGSKGRSCSVSFVEFFRFPPLHLTFNPSPHCSLYISYGTDKENLSKKYIW